ncbi:Imm8 family immunity protein [Acinetobacter sp. ESL0695]|uniref:Imm8 family immunity protein n=1 Tax=Acinetobacter sp. ESL0695 TaxID=2983215 RepID=UPI0023F18E5B|nr:Imm8 family immunity protein [Acinetobacter sp. ESL0695]WEV49346.1 Imm8 family immunity protein [Acinetobacter sp. ESL0695]
MKAELKSIDWCGRNPFDYIPENQDDLHITLTCSIGIKGLDGADYFDINISSPEYLAKSCFIDTILRNTLIVSEYDIKKIINIIHTYIDKCDGEDWTIISEKLSRYFFWEFEDYS